MHEMLQHGRDEIGHRMIVQIRRDKAHPEHAVRIPLVFVLRPRRLQRRFELPAEMQMFFEESGRSDCCIMREREQQIAVHLVPLRIDCKRMPASLCCLIDTTCPAQRGGEIVVGQIEIGIISNGGGKMDQRFIDFFQQQLAGPQVEMRGREIRRDSQCHLVSLHCQLDFSLRLQY